MLSVPKRFNFPRYLSKYVWPGAIFLLLLINGKSFSQDSKNFKISGFIKDTKNNAIDGATISLSNRSGEIVQSQISHENGSFTVSAPSDLYKLTISYLGKFIYRRDTIDLKYDLELGTIKVNLSEISLKEVHIQSSDNKGITQSEGRKLVYNVDRSIIAQGSSALEALKKTPGVIVLNNESKFTINGVNGALVLINGRQTYLQQNELAQLLKSMPSSNIKSIELIKNPSAEYEAEGTGGIINILLKKALSDGFNGNVNVGLARGVTLKQNADLSLNYRSHKWFLFGNYNHNFGGYKMNYDNNRITGGKIYINPNDDFDKRHIIGTNIGAEYEIDTLQTVGLVLTTNSLNGPGIISPQTYVYDENTGNLLEKLISESNYYHQIANRYNLNGYYRYKISPTGTLNINAAYGLFDGNSKNLNTNKYYSATGAYLTEANYHVINSKKIKLYAFNIDYNTDLWKGKVSVGAKFSSVSADNKFNLFNIQDNEDIVDFNRSNYFKNTEQIFAGYLKYEGSLSEYLSYDIGLRIENTQSIGDLIPVQGSNKFPVSNLNDYLDYFPSASLSYKTKHSGTFNLSYSYRIDRPVYNDLNPFESPIDELSYWKGNPFLKPQYARILSLQYNYKKTTVSLNYQQTKQIKAEIPGIIELNKMVMEPQNIGEQKNLNLSLTQQLSLSKKWELTIAGTGYYLSNRVSYPLYGEYNPNIFAGQLNLQQTIKLPYKITAEINAAVNSGTLVGLNGRLKANSKIDLGVQKAILKDRGVVRLMFTDIYRGDRYNTYSYLNGLRQHTTFVGESRQIKLNLSYKFGSDKVKDKEHRESGLETENRRL